jgi:hypothetical protein
MNVGADDRKKLIVAIVLMVLAVSSVGYWVVSLNGSPSSAASTAAAGPTPVVTAPRAAAHSRAGNKKVAVARSLDPSLRYDWLKASEDTKYSGTGRNIFRAQAEIPVALTNGTSDHGKKPLPTPPAVDVPPPPPPINLKFFGFASKPGELKKVFLSQGEDVFIAHEGDIVDRRYKVVRISPVAVEIEDVLNNNRQSIPLTQQQ